MGGVAGGWATGQTPRRQRCGSKKTKRHKRTKTQKDKKGRAREQAKQITRAGGGAGAAGRGRRTASGGWITQNTAKHNTHTYAKVSKTQHKHAKQARQGQGREGEAPSGQKGRHTKHTHRNTTGGTQERRDTRHNVGHKERAQDGRLAKGEHTKQTKARAHKTKRYTGRARGGGLGGTRTTSTTKTHKRAGRLAEEAGPAQGGGRGQGVTRRDPGQRVEGVGGR